MTRFKREVFRLIQLNLHNNYVFRMCVCVCPNFNSFCCHSLNSVSGRLADEECKDLSIRVVRSVTDL